MSDTQLSDEYDAEGLYVHGPQRSDRLRPRRESAADLDQRQQVEAEEAKRARLSRRAVSRLAAAMRGHSVPVRPRKPAVPVQGADARWHPRFVPPGPAPYTREQVAAAREEFAAARKCGAVTPALACECCDRTGVRIHGHHTDYARPLSVMWLCTDCHRLAHGYARPAHLMG